jgi:hypothetical protein
MVNPKLRVQGLRVEALGLRVEGFGFWVKRVENSIEPRGSGRSVEPNRNALSIVFLGGH